MSAKTAGAKTHKRSVPGRGKKARDRVAPTKTTALAVVAPTKIEPWVLRAEQTALLKRTVAKGTTDDEFALFLWVAKKHKLDPMTRQLHCVKRWSSKLNAEVMSIQIGIDGYRSMAARYPDYGGIDEPEYEFDEKKKGPDNPAGLILARVRVWKKGFDHATVGIAFWDEYKPDFAKPDAFMWRKMPRGQLAKCAEALGLRKAYPDLADIYTDDEMLQADDNHAPSGRAMTIGQAEPHEGTKEAAQAVADRKIAEHKARQAQEPPSQTATVPKAVIPDPPRCVTEVQFQAFLDDAYEYGWQKPEIQEFLERNGWKRGGEVPQHRLAWLMDVARLGEDGANELHASRTNP